MLLAASFTAYDMSGRPSDIELSLAALLGTAWLRQVPLYNLQHSLPELQLPDRDPTNELWRIDAPPQ